MIRLVNSRARSTLEDSSDPPRMAPRFPVFGMPTVGVRVSVPTTKLLLPEETSESGFPMAASAICAMAICFPLEKFAIRVPLSPSLMPVSCAARMPSCEVDEAADVWANWVMSEVPSGLYSDQSATMSLAPLVSPVVVAMLTGDPATGEVSAPVLSKDKLHEARDVGFPAVPPVRSSPGMETSQSQAFEPVLVKL